MAQVIFIHDGGSIDHIPVADVQPGDVVVQGELVGVAKLGIKAGMLGALAVQGVFDFPVPDTAGWAVGDFAYWDDAADQATKTATGNKPIGKAVGIRPGSVPYVRVRLNQ